jgi:dihydrofolate reductase
MMMRRIVFGVANSLDNFIAGKDGTIDWLMFSDETAMVLSEYWATIDTILMGRNTYVAALKQGGTSPDFGNIKTYIFARELEIDTADGVEIIPNNAVEFVRTLKEKDGKDICLMGGGIFAKTLFESDLIDELHVNIHPVLLGQGIPLFLDIKKQIDLELIDCRPFKNGCVNVSYRVKKSRN